MGTSMASVSFRRSGNWDTVKPRILELFAGTEGIVSNLESDGPGYAIVSPYGDMGMFLAELPQKISALTGDYAVMCVCVDSDYALMELYNGGILLEECAVGDVYDDFDDVICKNKADMRLWKALLTDPERLDELSDALYAEEIFVEAQLRVISALTGMPIFDDNLVYGEAGWTED